MTALAPQPEGPQGMESQRFGSRWLYAHPEEQDVKTWFDGQRLHPGMDHEPYYGGIVVIGAQEKVKQTFQNAAGAWLVREAERMTFTPYVKVDTRIAYFHDLVAQLCGEQAFSYIGVIEPVPVKVIYGPPVALLQRAPADRLLHDAGPQQHGARERQPLHRCALASGDLRTRVLD